MRISDWSSDVCSSDLAFEAMSGNAIRAALDHTASTRNPFPAGKVPDLVLLVELSRTWPPRDGEPSLNDVLTIILGAIWEIASEPLVDAFIGKSEEMWSLRHEIGRASCSERVFEY